MARRRQEPPHLVSPQGSWKIGTVALIRLQHNFVIVLWTNQCHTAERRKPRSSTLWRHRRTPSEHLSPQRQSSIDLCWYRAREECNNLLRARLPALSPRSKKHLGTI